MNANSADRLTGNITAVGGITVGVVLLAGSFFGVAGALVGTVVGLVLGILIVRQRNGS